MCKSVMIPDSEVAGEFRLAIGSVGWGEVSQAIKDSLTLLDKTIKGDAEYVSNAFDNYRFAASSILGISESCLFPRCASSSKSSFTSVNSGFDDSHALKNLAFSHPQDNGSENSMACAIKLAYYAAISSYKIIREMPAGKGFADMVFVPLKNSTRPAIVVELKYDKTAKAAIDQIKEKNYPEGLKGVTNKILLVGINYDKAAGKHQVEIEEG